MKSKYPSWNLRITSVFILAIASSSGPALAEVLPAASEPDPHVKARVAEAYGNLPLSFEANQGQTDPRVKFLARGGGYTLFLTNSEAVLALGGAKRQAIALARGHRTHEAVGANPGPSSVAWMSCQGKAITSSATIPTKWKTEVPNYARVRYQSIYPGVDLIYYGNQGRLEYDFLVAQALTPKRSPGCGGQRSTSAQASSTTKASDESTTTEIWWSA